MCDKKYLLNVTKKLLETPSPSGYTFLCQKELISEIEKLGYQVETNKKGNVIVKFGSGKKTIGVSAHFDTLGLMVTNVGGNGNLSFTRIGGPILPTLDGEYCHIHTREGKKYSGTILSNSPSSHVYANAQSLERNEKTMHIRIDELIENKEDLKKLGINNGDYISIDPKVLITENGFIKSRFLDDKISVGILLALLKALKDKKLNKTIYFIFSCYEEVGFGASSIPELDEFIACDMGCVGDTLQGSSQKVSICPNDSSGPYDFELTTKLINIAKSLNLDYAIDVFPYYGSDVSAARRAGNDFKGALIGPGVEASHGMERCHINGVMHTFNLLYKYLNE